MTERYRIFANLTVDSEVDKGNELFILKRLLHEKGYDVEWVSIMKDDEVLSSRKVYDD